MPGEDAAPGGEDERLADAAARLGEALDEAVAAVARSFQPLALALAGALRALAADPVARFAMDHPELLRAERPKPCWCLCARAHPGQVVCDGEGVTTRTVVLKLYGPVQLQQCRACAVAQGITGPAG